MHRWGKIDSTRTESYVSILSHHIIKLASTHTIQVRTTVQEKGPILISMIGRLYHEEKGHDFKDAFPIGLTKFLQKYLGDELNYTTLKGVEMLVECKLDKKPKPEALVKRDEKRAKEGGEEAHSGPVPCLLRARLQSAPKAVPYTKDDKILVVGDGDFSWSRAVAVSFQPGGHLSPLPTPGCRVVWDALVRSTRSSSRRQKCARRVLRACILRNRFGRAFSSLEGRALGGCLCRRCRC